jgi:para-nitrobenzyl esterase
MGSNTRTRRLTAALLGAGLAMVGVLGGAAAEAAPPAERSSGPPLVVTTNGPVVGVTTPQLREFLGIPYAAPPVGPRRWRPPDQAAPWTTPRDSSHFGPHCPQGPSAFGTASTSEDCLYLNVYTPPARHGHLRRGLPVMVWIHGGALTIGESDDFDPTRLVTDGDVIVVTINYRLGALGFLAHPALSAESQYDGSGNYGLMDQQLALQWVRDNIGAFGGNPHRVTIFGESAGGLSVHAHLASPLAAGLFDRAIAQSGAYALTQPPLAAAEAFGSQFAAAVGCADLNTAAACLRTKPVESLIAAGGTNWVPNIDGDVLPRSILDVLTSGDFNRVPVIEGTTADEWRLQVALFFDLLGGPLQADFFDEAIGLTLGIFGLPSSAVPDIIQTYPLSAYPSPDLALGAVGTDAIFACPALRASRLLADHVRTFGYEFNDTQAPQIFLPPVSYPYGAYHASELQYLFDVSTPLHPEPALLPDPAQQALARDMVTYWTEFAKHGSPIAHETPRWPIFRGRSELVQSLAPQAVAPIDDFAAEHHCQFWASHGL